MSITGLTLTLVLTAGLDPGIERARGTLAERETLSDPRAVRNLLMISGEYILWFVILGEEKLEALPSGPEVAPMALWGEQAKRKILNQEKPEASEIFNRIVGETTVILKFWVDPQGNVKNIQIIRSSGYLFWDLLCVAALKKWKFGPKDTHNDEWGQLTIRFYKWDKEEK